MKNPSCLLYNPGHHHRIEVDLFLQWQSVIIYLIHTSLRQSRLRIIVLLNLILHSLVLFAADVASIYSRCSAQCCTYMCRECRPVVPLQIDGIGGEERGNGRYDILRFVGRHSYRILGVAEMKRSHAHNII